VRLRGAQHAAGEHQEEAISALDGERHRNHGDEEPEGARKHRRVSKLEIAIQERSDRASFRQQRQSDEDDDDDPDGNKEALHFGPGRRCWLNTRLT
jgi:hypothetical protein